MMRESQLTAASSLSRACWTTLLPRAPAQSNRAVERFSHIAEALQARFYVAVALNSGGTVQFGYAKDAGAADTNYIVVKRSVAIKLDKHMASRVFSPNDLENLDSYMMKYRKHGIVELLDNKLAGGHISCVPAA